MRAQGTSALDGLARMAAAALPATTATAAQVDELSYTELTVALYASGMPTAKGRPSQEEIAAWAAQGLASLGPARLWQLDYSARRAGGREPGFSAAWPSPRRHATACALAHRYLWARKALGYDWPTSPIVYVEVPEPDSDTTWQVPVLSRDLECARRWGWPAAAPWQRGEGVNPS
jgi:hypothetical protein